MANLTISEAARRLHENRQRLAKLWPNMKAAAPVLSKKQMCAWNKLQWRQIDAEIKLFTELKKEDPDARLADGNPLPSVDHLQKIAQIGAFALECGDMRLDGVHSAKFVPRRRRMVQSLHGLDGDIGIAPIVVGLYFVGLIILTYAAERVVKAFTGDQLGQMEERTKQMKLVIDAQAECFKKTGKACPSGVVPKPSEDRGGGGGGGGFSFGRIVWPAVLIGGGYLLWKNRERLAPHIARLRDRFATG